MEFSFLYAIPRSAVLDGFFLNLTRIAGSYGRIWVIVAILMLIFKKIRKAGVAVLFAYLMVFFLGQVVMKHLISRPHPCQIDQAFSLLVARPSSSSFPSTHSAWAFGAATSVYMQHRKMGIAVYVVAVLIAFSRLYMFLHFPTDVLFGAALGISLGVFAHWITTRVWKRFENSKA